MTTPDTDSKELAASTDEGHRRARLITGISLIAASLPISFWNPVSAGFFFLTGVFACVTVVLDWTRLRSLKLSLTEISAELFQQIEQKVESAEAILREIREVEERISFILTEQMLNRGGHRYIGGFGEEAEFAIYRAMQDSKLLRNKKSVEANLQELHRDLGFQLCNGIFGMKWHAESAVHAWLVSTNYRILPDRQKIEEFAFADGVDLGRVSELVEAYVRFCEEDVVPSDELVRRLYDYKNFKE